MRSRAEPGPGPRVGPGGSLLLSLLVLAALGGCRSTQIDASPDAGRTRSAEAGTPAFDLEAFAALQDGARGVQVRAAAPRGAFVAAAGPDGAGAAYEWLVRVLDASGDRLVVEDARTDTLRAAGDAAGPLVLDAWLSAAPGAYVVEAALTDLSSDRTERRRVRVRVPAAGEAFLTSPRLFARTADGLRPELALHVPEPAEALVGRVSVLAEAPAAVTLRLLRAESDTSVAEVPHAFGLMPMIDDEVRYDRSDTLAVRTVRTADTLGLPLPRLTPGVYRLEAQLGADGPTTARDFTVQAPSFPEVSTWDELIGPLAYLAERDELERLRAAGSPAETRRRFDAFWGELIGDRRTAAAMLERYYARVEEANRYFTRHKAGWKTDQGMIYIVLGPPLYVESHGDTETWHYSYIEREGADAYVFERLRSPRRSAFGPSYVLRRDQAYRQPWREAVQRWRDGRALR